MSSGRRLWRFTGYIFSSLAALVLVLVISPLTLALIGMIPLDWNKLNAVGQSYTRISALLSGAALVGLITTIRLQARQVQASQHQALREMHLTLNQMALSDPALAFGLSNRRVNDEEAFQRWRVEIFSLMWLRYLQFGYSLEVFPDSFVRVVIAEVFEKEAGRAVWRRAGASMQYADKPEPSEKFRKIVSEELARIDGQGGDDPH